MNNNQYYNFGETLNILSLLIGLQNLQENRQQSEHNDVQSANDKQAKYLLNEINKRFNEQNEILYQQNKKIDELIDLLNTNLKQLPL